MKLKDKLVLRNIAGRYVVVPIGKRVREVGRTINLSNSAAYLWDFMKNDEFTVESLTDLIMARYQGVTKEKAQSDIENFLAVLKRNNMLEPEPGETEQLSGYVTFKIDEKDQKKIENLKDLKS